jgi:hypothetical protein
VSSNRNLCRPTEFCVVRHKLKHFNLCRPTKLPTRRGVNKNALAYSANARLRLRFVCLCFLMPGDRDAV